MDYKQLEKVNSEIKLTDIKGKGYAEVPERISAFRKLFPTGQILTEMLSCQDGMCIFRASISDGEKVLATGHAYETEGSTFINKTSYIENCETSAVGRALGMMGIIGGGSIASYEEVANAKLNQDKPKRGRKNQPMAPGAIDYPAQIRNLAAEKGIPEIEICNMGGVTAIEQMVEGQMVQCINWLQSEPARA